MQLSAQIRFIAIVGVVISASLAAQTPPAKASAALPPAQSTQQPLTASQRPPRPAEVTYTGGELFVSANNFSLNQILRDIGRQTGMKITGGVADERVFGQYGPAAPSKVLGTLLDGTGSNMLLLQATSAAPAELILTPRQGGPTPPNPNASTEEDTSTEAPASRPFFQPAQPQYPPATPPQTNAPGAPAASQPGQQSPNAVKTPQQIYEQLQRLRQQQQQTNPQ